jgi:hypothetical protein
MRKMKFCFVQCRSVDREEIHAEIDHQVFKFHSPRNCCREVEFNLANFAIGNENSCARNFIHFMFSLDIHLQSAQDAPQYARAT